MRITQTFINALNCFKLFLPNDPENILEVSFMENETLIRYRSDETLMKTIKLRRDMIIRKS